MARGWRSTSRSSTLAMAASTRWESLRTIVTAISTVRFGPALAAISTPRSDPVRTRPTPTIGIWTSSLAARMATASFVSELFARGAQFILSTLGAGHLGWADPARYYVRALL